MRCSVRVTREQARWAHSLTRSLHTHQRQHQYHSHHPSSSSRVAWSVATGVAAAATYTIMSQTVASCEAEPARQPSSSSSSSTSSSPSHSSSLASCHAALNSLLGDRFSLDASDLASHGADAYSYHKGGSSAGEGENARMPSAVVFPLTTEEVSEIVKICAKHRVNMIPYGSGTSLEGHTTAPSGGVCIDLSRMCSIKRLNASDLDVVVEAGMSWNNLNAELSEHGLFYPVDPGPGASIGGMIGTSCSGTNAVRYGTMKQNVINLTVVLPDGSIVHTGQRARKSSAGYDLTRLFIGSEGTLGIVTEATLRLQPLPESIAVATCSFDSLRSASEAVQEIMQKGVRINCVELLDDGCMRAVNAYAGLNYPEKAATLFFKFSGSKATVNDEVDATATITAKHGAGPFTFATDAQARDKIWEARKGALWACIAYRDGAEAWTTDVCVPISHLADCIQATKQDLLELPAKLTPVGEPPVSFPTAVVGHVGDGNFHVMMMMDPSNPRELHLAQQVNERMVRRAISMEGTCTGEHGVGVGKKKYLREELGTEAIQLMRTIKRAIDPYNLMNPGKVFDMDDEENVQRGKTLIITDRNNSK